MKPLFEKIDKNIGSSFTVRRYDYQHLCMPFWHLHPEYELVFIKNGHGKRHVGNHMSYYNDGELILLGPYVPHASFSNTIYESNEEVVIHLSEHFLGEEFLSQPEMLNIRKLLDRSFQGVTFGNSVKRRLQDRLLDLDQMNYFDRLISLLCILQDMANSTDYTMLDADKPTLIIKDIDYNRINKVYEYVQKHFKNDINIGTVADNVNMTLPAFCRFFKQVTEKTFTSFVNEFRISYACELISKGDLSIAEIGYSCGFQSVSYFNRKFKKIIGMPPLKYRSQFQKIVSKHDIN